MSQTGSNHETNRVESPFEWGQNQTISNAESNRVESRVKQGRIMVQIWPKKPGSSWFK